MNWTDSIEIEAAARLQAEADRLWQEWIGGGAA